MYIYSIKIFSALRRVLKAMAIVLWLLIWFGDDCLQVIDPGAAGGGRLSAANLCPGSARCCTHPPGSPSPKDPNNVQFALVKNAFQEVSRDEASICQLGGEENSGLVSSLRVSRRDVCTIFS